MAITETILLNVKILNSAQRSMQVAQEGIRGFGQGLAMTNEEMKKNTAAGKTAGQRMAFFGGRVKQAFVGLRGFRMEMLSVMFFGLGMKNMFQGLLRPAFEMVGIFELLSTALAILFLPVALMVLEDVIIPLFNWITNLSPETKKLIGVFALGGVALGTLLFFFGSAVLGVGGLLVAFGGLIAVILTLVTSPLALLISSLAGLLIFGKLSNLVSGLQPLFSGLIMVGKSFISSVLEKMGITTDDVREKIEEFASTAWTKFKDFFGNTQLGKDIEDLKNKIIDFAKQIKLFLVGGEDESMAMSVEGIIPKVQKLTQEFLNLGTEINKMMPDVVKLLTFMVGIVDALNNVISGFSSLDDEWRKFKEEPFAPRTPPASLVAMATGGIVTRPTPALIGEAGPEAVIPLDKAGMLGGSITNNITVNASMSNMIDPSNLADMIGREVASQTERALRR